MFKSIKIIGADFRKLGSTVFLNIIHLMLKGLPFGILFFVVSELTKPREEIDKVKLYYMFAAMGIFMAVNVFVAIKVHVMGYINSFTITTEARLKLGDHLRKLSLGFFKKRDPGDISSLLLQDMAKVETIFSHFLIDSIACLVLPVLMASFFFAADFRLAGIMVFFVFAAVPALAGAQRIIDSFGKKHIATRNKVASRLLEYLQGIKVLIAYNLTGSNFKRLESTMKTFCRDSIKLEAAAGGPVMIYLFILECGFISVLLFGAHLFVKGEIAFEIFLAFLVIGYKFFEPLINFGIFTSEMKYMSLAAARISRVIETKPLKEPEKCEIPDNYDIEFENVSFGYDDEKKVLKNIYACFKENSVTALVGPSGSGKTTLTSLIARFWDVKSGSVKIGGKDIRNIEYEKLNSMLSIVFQDVYLFQDTIFNNIKVGRKNASEEEVFNAAEKAGCHEFIMEFENGYQTMAGEGGARLSGGEKQRISIARALLKDAPIVLLDEATASLDPENELVIQKAIGEMVKNKTLIIIAHRLKTIKTAHQILVLEKGMISEAGTHGELLRNNLLYSRMWKEQEKSGGWKFKDLSENAFMGERALNE
ncbi:MAG: ABC transporter ATP-binding protein [Desulfobacteraceae bacterium]|nr:ABC transporter ATP-binding protein [Desulfobacteraceae bacterium]MCB9494158.1 ABC transporter ATP-binding protein [Desulfobacteraceae bacterium]